MQPRPARTKVDRALRLFGPVEAHEGLTVILLGGIVFLSLLSYYLLKTAREPLVLMTGGAELRSYAAAVQALSLVVIVPVYGRAAARVGRGRLLLGLGLVFLAGLELFFVGALVQMPFLGFLFYVFVGVFGVTLVAQFWAFANDLYPTAAGERLFPIVAIGASSGSVAGSWLAKRLFATGVPTVAIVQLAAIVLLAHIALYAVVFRRAEARRQGALAERPLAPTGGFELVFRRPYVGRIAWMLVLLNLVNTTGEYILGQEALSQARSAADLAAASLPSLDRHAFVEAHLGRFYGGFYTWVNVACVLLQALVVSRVVRWTGIGGIVFALPVVALGSYALVGAGVGLAVFQWMKVAENATDYSLMNTAKAMLWLPTTRDEKYKAKQAVDTFFVRFGDVLSAGLVFVGTELVALGPRGFAAANVVLVIVWLVVAVDLVRRYRRAVEERALESAAAEHAAAEHTASRSPDEPALAASAQSQPR